MTSPAPTPNIADALERSADLFPDDVAISQGDRVFTWRELDTAAARLAGHLHSTGVRQGTRVAIGMRNSPEYLIGLFATIKLRAVAVNVNFRYEPAELEYILRDSGSAVLLFDSALAGSLCQLLEREPDLVHPLYAGPPDPALPSATTAWSDALEAAPAPRVERGDDEWLLYTGGTTGLPKAVSRAHSTVMSLVSVQAFLLLGRPLPSTDSEWREALVEVHPRRLSMLICAPLMHGTGVYNSLTALVTGGQVALLPSPSFDPALVATELERRSVTDLSVVGDVMALPLVQELERAAAEGRPYNTSSLRRMQATGTVWSASVKARLLQQLDIVLFDVLAATEGGPYALAISDRATPVEQLGSFRLAPGARLLDELDRDIAPGSGQIGWLAAPAGPMAYVNDPAKSAQAWRHVDGRLYSFAGDLARLEADGSLTFMGRGSSVINTGGEKVHTAEVEDVLRGHPNVTDAAVVGVPDERWGHTVGAVLERAPGTEVDPTELDALSDGRLARYKRPRVVVVVDKLERTTTGKINLRWAQAVLAEQASAGPTARGNEPERDRRH